MGQFMNQRNFPRLYMNAETTITTSSGDCTGIVENISLGGVFVRTSERIGVGDNTCITISLPPENIVAKGIAVRTEETGVAFKFHNVDHNTFCALLSLLGCPNA